MYFLNLFFISLKLSKTLFLNNLRMKKILPFVFLLIFILLGVNALFHPGFYTSHDGEHQVIRLYRFADGISDGQFPVRWAKDLDNGYGYPLFNFTYQAPWFIGLPLLKLGFSLTDTVKGIFIIGYFLSGLFMYLWLRRKTGNWGGFFGAILYLWAPYRFSNIFVRASLGEATVFMFLPLLFWGIEKASEKKSSISSILLITIGLSGIILSHLMGLIIFILPLIFWIILNIFQSESKINTFKKIVIGSMLGISLSAYYLFPAILEKNFTQAADLLTSHYKDHFVSLLQLIYSKWDYGFDFPGTISDAMSFQIGIAQWLVIICSLILIIYLIYTRIKQKNILKLLTINPALPVGRSSLLTFAFCLVTFAFSIFMMLPLSAPLWQLIVKYSYFDFPWRFLGLSVFATAVCGAYLISIINRKLGRGVMHYAPTIIILIIALYANRNHLRVNQYVFTPDSFYQNNANTTNQYDEYRPKSLNADYAKKNRPKMEYNRKNIVIIATDFQSNSFYIEGTAFKKDYLIINLSYFPGWEIYINGKKQDDIINTDGVMKVNVLSNFYVTGVFSNTNLRNLSNIISIITCIILLFFCLSKNNFFKQARNILPGFLIWKTFLIGALFFGNILIPLREGYLGGGKDVNIYLSNPSIYAWTNMDGAHYVSIAKYGYMQFEQAFFPLYPIFIRFLSDLLYLSPYVGSQLLSNCLFFAAIAFFYYLIKSKYSHKNAIWTIIFLLSFPTSFFFNAAYTESLFLLLVVVTFYFSNRQKWFLAGFFGALASATRLAGVFLFPALLLELWLLYKKNINPQPLRAEPSGRRPATRNSLTRQLLCICLIPFGLLSYMFYLWKTLGDPFYFFHVQPLFGANRTGGTIILLPQVIYRYFKIFFTASFSYDYIIALIEFSGFFLAAFLLIKGFKKIPLSWQIFSWLSLLVPPLTGSFSSIPRYILTIFPIYYLLSEQSKILRYLLLIIFIILQMILAGFYLRGYFVA